MGTESRRLLFDFLALRGHRGISLSSFCQIEDSRAQERAHSSEQDSTMHQLALVALCNLPKGIIIPPSNNQDHKHWVQNSTATHSPLLALLFILIFSSSLLSTSDLMQYTTFFHLLQPSQGRRWAKQKETCANINLSPSSHFRGTAKVLASLLLLVCT